MPKNSFSNFFGFLGHQKMAKNENFEKMKKTTPDISLKMPKKPVTLNFWPLGQAQLWPQNPEKNS